MPPCTGPGPCGDCGGIDFTTADGWIDVTKVGGCNFDLGWDRTKVAGLVDDGDCSILDYDTINFTPGKITSKIGPPRRNSVGSVLSGGVIGSLTWPTAQLLGPINSVAINNNSDVCERDAYLDMIFWPGWTTVTPADEVQSAKGFRLDVTHLVDIGDGSGFVARSRQTMFGGTVSFSPVPDPISYAVPSYLEKIYTLSFGSSITAQQRKQYDLSYQGPGPLVLTIDESDAKILVEREWDI